VLELGCGTGRVALDLAAAGFEVTGIDRDPDLLEALARRADERGLRVDAKLADARELDLGRRFALIIAPMQLVHLVGGASGRAAMLRRARDHLAPRARFPVTLLDHEAARSAGTGHDLSGLAPDVREVGGWVYSSLPVDIVERPEGIEVRRLRHAVAPGGELTESLDITVLAALTVDELERDAFAAGLGACERIAIAPTADHVGSTVVVLEAEA
jgi:SAM-dependent methyltransferase